MDSTFYSGLSKILENEMWTAYKGGHRKIVITTN